MEDSKYGEWKAVLIVFQHEDREEILNILMDRGIQGIAKAREQRRINNITLVTDRGRRGAEICVAPDDVQKAGQIIAPWLEQKKTERRQSRSFGSAFMGKNEGTKGKALTVAVVVVAVLIYLTRLMA